MTDYPTVTSEQGPLREPDFHADWTGYAVVRRPVDGRPTLMAEEVVALIGDDETGDLVARTLTSSGEVKVETHPAAQVVQRGPTIRATGRARP